MIHRDPGIGQQFAEPIGGMRRQSFQNVLEVSKGIDLDTMLSIFGALIFNGPPDCPVPISMIGPSRATTRPR
jgi:hypothetical protein